MGGPDYKRAGYIDSYNKALAKHCDWEVELFNSPHNGQYSLKVFRLGSKEESQNDHLRFFMGCIPPETPVGALICCGSLCLHYYKLGVSEGGVPASM